MKAATMTVRPLLMASAAIAMTFLTPAAFAQDSAENTARRIDRIERELRAVQRRVFPGADNGLFTPEVQPQDAAPATPANPLSPVGDLNARIDAIEAQLARMTGQVEQQEFRQRELAASIAQLRTELNTRIDALASAAPTEASPAPSPTPTPATGTVRPAVTPATRPAASPAPTPTPSATRPPARATPAPTPAPTAANANNAARRARVEAIEVPSTGNAAEDAYIYGFRLWEARLYPEAQTQLQRVVDNHPTHRRASYAGNLLGRAYLDNDQPSLAVRAFYDNYRNRPRGERAADSVYYMGMALIQLDRRADACRTFDEFDRVYGADASQSLKDRVAEGRVTARC